MKKNRSHIFHAWMLLFCFTAGQFVLYAHQHPGNTGITGISKFVYQNPNKLPKQTVSENCHLCDAMQHNQMSVNIQVYFAPVIATCYIYKIVKYDFINIALIHSAGRSPPLA